MRYKRLLWLILGLAAISLVFQLHDNIPVFSLASLDEPVPILMYHKVSPASPFNGPGMRVNPQEFEKQMQYLSQNGYKTISLDQLYKYWDKGSALPAHPIVITFDDGYRDNYTYAFPILKKYNLKATIFVVYNEIGGYNKWDAKNHPARRLKLLSRSQILEMQNYGISFESHTLTHPKLTELSPNEAYREILLSKESLSKALGKPVHFIAYPYGSYNDKVLKLIQRAGYKAAVTTAQGTNTRKTNPYLLKRLRINAYVSMQKFRKMVDDFHSV